jgi:alkylation response protein AidB-like acyl-CoA dehydrogenase
MRQPGVEARPIRQMNGEASFCETFFTDARVPHENVVGEVNGGWAVALTTLAHERYGTAGPAGLLPLRKGGPARERVPNARTWLEAIKGLARESGKAEDPVFRQRIAYVWSLRELARLNTLRARALAAAGRAGPEGSVGKLWGSKVRATTAALNLALLGAAGALAGEDAPLSGSLQKDLLSYPSLRIAGGTDEIQLNIIGERVLGLPKESQLDKDVPFREVRGGR